VFDGGTVVVTNYLISGAINGLVLIIVAFALSRFVGDIYGRALLVIFLILAGGAYFGFATAALTSGLWLLAELLHVLVIGAMGLQGLRGSPYWIAGGWALHPLWDWPLHYLGPGNAFAPDFYAIACITFDWLVALYIVIAYGTGLVGARRATRRGAARSPALR
jgi:hypothetical protein